jgi:hypothetical protein
MFSVRVKVKHCIKVQHGFISTANHTWCGTMLLLLLLVVVRLQLRPLTLLFLPTLRNMSFERPGSNFNRFPTKHLAAKVTKY